MVFKDRIEAGKKLAAALGALRGEDVVVLALPRGGVPLAAEVARSLHAPMDLLLVRKLGVPSQPELAMGAVMDGTPPVVIRNDDVVRQAWVSGEEFNAVKDRELAEIERRRQRYLAGRPPVDVRGRIALIVDDGIATGATVKAAIAGLRKLGPERIVVAAPVAPPDTAAELRRAADEVVILEEPVSFGAIGSFYRDFRQLSDDDVVALMSKDPAH
jgi:putative phosphoribosyl transferase